jgi:VWFA-related protein
VIGLALTLFAPFALTAQDLPRFSANLDHVQVDVHVTDRNGRAVRDLVKEDFVLLEDDVPQRVETFALVDVSSPRAHEQSAGVDSPAGRSWVLLLGFPSPQAERIALTFANSVMGPNDQVAVRAIFKPTSDLEFTRNRTLVRETIERWGGEPFVMPSWGDRLLQLNPSPPHTPFTVLEDICNRLGALAGRKNIVFVNPPAMQVADERDPIHRAMFRQRRDAIRAATRHNVAIYVVSQLTFEAADFGLGGLGNADLRELSEPTGGEAILNGNYAATFRRWVEETSAYYLLGYTPPTVHRDDRFHRLTVRVRRPGLNVRARPGYYGLPVTPAAAPAGAGAER